MTWRPNAPSDSSGQAWQPSTRKLLNSSQIVVDTYTTDAFGNSVASTGSATDPYQWNAGGKYYSDYESGLQKAGAPYHEPATGRRLSQDRLMVAGNRADTQVVVRYVYCGANPIGRVDPSDHDWPPAVVWIVDFLTAPVLEAFVIEECTYRIVSNTLDVTVTTIGTWWTGRIGAWLFGDRPAEKDYYTGLMGTKESRGFRPAKFAAWRQMSAPPLSGPNSASTRGSDEHIALRSSLPHQVTGFENTHRSAVAHPCAAAGRCPGGGRRVRAEEQLGGRQGAA